MSRAWGSETTGGIRVKLVGRGGGTRLANWLVLSVKGSRDSTEGENTPLSRSEKG